MSGWASHTSSRCSTAPVAASPASFQPSNAATRIGLVSSGQSCPSKAAHASTLRPVVAASGDRHGARKRADASVTLTAWPTFPGLALLDALAERVVVADGAMGTMLQARRPEAGRLRGSRGLQRDPQRHPAGRRPRAFTTPTSQAGSDAVETNTFGANWANLAEYDIVDRIHELARAGAALAREVADDFSTPDRPRWVLGSVGPGTKLPTLGHVQYSTAARRLPGAGRRA